MLVQMRGLVVVLVVGCAHVELAPPAPNMTPQQRVQTFHAKRPYGRLDELTYRNGMLVDRSSSLVFADGTNVRHADDLIPLIPSNGPAARAARKSASARTKKLAFGAVGVAALIGGFLWFKQAEIDPVDASISPTIPLLTAGGAGVALVAYAYYHGVEQRQRMIAFGMYEQELGQALQVCAAGLQIVPCEEIVPSPPTTPPSGKEPPGSVTALVGDQTRSNRTVVLDRADATADAAPVAHGCGVSDEDPVAAACLGLGHSRRESRERHFTLDRRCSTRGRAYACCDRDVHMRMMRSR